MNRKFLAGIASGAFLLVTVTVVQAAPVTNGYSFTIGGNANIPTVILVNTSTSTADIVDFSMTIGDTAYNFDNAYQEVLGSVDSFTLVSPDTNLSGGVRSDVVYYTFTGFDPGETFKFNTDVDPDNSNVSINFTTVLFNNGVAPNSVLTVIFSNNITLSGPLPDYVAGPYTFSQSTAVPLPGALFLMGSGLVGLFGLRRKVKS